ncbi:MAG: ribosomal protein S18-alanine N-acetyltransferase [Oscillospiraceae bacterium]|jgi:ribosomal-protein-alanine N-acetyltransferase|nr:ribosomal protein S18-alanine N-acetyltransferase [Oscillospiraceae bacterium]
MMQIVPMAAQHVQQVAQLETRCFSDPWSVRSIEAELENPLSFWLVALEGETVLGYVGSQTVPPESDVMNLAVAPEWRRSGIALQLLLQLTQYLEKSGVESLSLEVRENNRPACSLYIKMGFVIVGRRPGYYRNPQEDALIMRKELRHADTVDRIFL